MTSAAMTSARPDDLDFGVPRADLARICAPAVRDPTAAGNPVPLTEDLAARMLAAAFDG